MSVHPDAAQGPGVSRILEHVADWERRSRDHLVLVGLIPADAAVATGLITKVAARVRSAVEPELVERAHSAGMDVRATLRVKASAECDQLAKLTPFLTPRLYGRETFYALSDGEF